MLASRILLAVASFAPRGTRAPFGGAVAMSALGGGIPWGWSATWGSADWNWGYARGTAHDRAALLRSTLRSADARASWKEGPAPAGELLLGLALAVQRAQNTGRPTPVTGVVGALFAGSLRDEESTCDALLEKLQASDRSSAGLAAIAQMPAGAERNRKILAAALDSVQFTENGM